MEDCSATLPLTGKEFELIDCRLLKHFTLLDSKKTPLKIYLVKEWNVPY